uniref:homeobox protein Mohawk isoform X3 n=1 Tax=Myxine glutinosa TaxID=7769 RepID=UPI00358DE154
MGSVIRGPDGVMSNSTAEARLSAGGFASHHALALVNHSRPDDTHSERLCFGGTQPWGLDPRERSGSRRTGLSKARHRRQALQDMARPLKHWLYKHRDNPYPTKTEKILLALGSHMTLVQVSNWFANARRRLKNTVRQPDLSWAMRIKLYNTYVQGNAERLSVCSDDSCCQGERLCGDEETDEAPTEQSPDSGGGVDTALTVENVNRQRCEPAFPRKFKNSLLHRYLRDSYRHALADPTQNPPSARGPSPDDGSLSGTSSGSERRHITVTHGGNGAITSVGRLPRQGNPQLWPGCERL